MIQVVPAKPQRDRSGDYAVDLSRDLQKMVIDFGLVTTKEDKEDQDE